MDRAVRTWQLQWAKEHNVGLSATPDPNNPGVGAWLSKASYSKVTRVLINMDWGLKLYYLDWGVWHIVPLGDVGQHTLPCSVPGRPCRRTPELDPGRGRGMGATSHLGGAGSERGGGHTPSSVVRWATSQLAPSEGVSYVSGCHAVKTPSMGRARLCRQCRW